jgi:hypothetical protein
MNKNGITTASTEGTRLQRWKPLPELKHLSDEAVAQMVTHLRRRALASIEAAELAEKLKRRQEPEHRTPEGIHEQIALAKALYESGRITQAECLFFCVIHVEDIHQTRWFDGQYNEIETISNQMDAIKKEYGLADDEEWEREDEPDDYRELSRNYDCLLDQRFDATLREFELTEEAELWRDDRAEFDRRREIGRSIVFDQSDVEKAVLSSVEIYEHQAQLCGDVKAFYPACVMLASAVESRLLLSCLRKPQEMLPQKAKPKNPTRSPGRSISSSAWPQTLGGSQIWNTMGLFLVCPDYSPIFVQFETICIQDAMPETGRMRSLGKKHIPTRSARIQHCDIL